LPRTVLFIAFSGEERGLLGSAHYVANPSVPLADTVAMVNLDMVGRLDADKLVVHGTGTGTGFDALVDRLAAASGLETAKEPGGFGPSDHSSFYAKKIPVLHLFTGSHADYHRPTDTAEKINYDDLDRIAGFAGTIARRLLDTDEPPLFTKVEQKTDTGGRAGLRIFTGTIPDYATDVKGLLLGGVIGGGPAEQAGLQKGDIIVELAGQSIANIYDYTYALDLLKIGQPATVVYTRGAARRTTTLTPSARK